jgi:hypothetical protein
VADGKRIVSPDWNPAGVRKRAVSRPCGTEFADGTLVYTHSHFNPKTFVILSPREMLPQS